MQSNSSMHCCPIAIKEMSMDNRPGSELMFQPFTEHIGMKANKCSFNSENVHAIFTIKSGVLLLKIRGYRSRRSYRLCGVQQKLLVMRSSTFVIAALLAVNLMGVSADDECYARDRALEQYSYTESIAPLIQLEAKTPKLFTALRPPGDGMLDALAFSQDNKTLYVTLAQGRSYKIAVSSHTVHGWSAPRLVGFSGRWNDFDEVVSADGQTMVFASDRPLRSPKSESLWMTQRVSTGWKSPQPLSNAVNSGRSSFGPTLAHDGTLYFTTVDEREHGHLRYSVPVDGAYLRSALAPFDDNDYASMDPTISPDGGFLIFVSNRPPATKGRVDLFITFNRDGHWSPPEDMGEDLDPVGDVNQPRISPDGKTLYYTTASTFCDPAVEGSKNEPHVWRLDLGRWLEKDCVGNVQGNCTTS